MSQRPRRAVGLGRKHPDPRGGVGRQRGDDLGGDATEVERDCRLGGAAGVEAGELEHAVDQRAHPAGFPVDHGGDPGDVAGVGIRVRRQDLR